MIFDRLSSPLALTLLLGVALVVLALYWLRPPAPTVTVASTLSWRRLAERSKRTRRWRRLISLLLSLLAALAMAAALAGLRVAPPGADGPPLVVVVDTSATMSTATAGGPSRLERAVAEARSEVARSAGPVDLYDTTGQMVRAGLTVADALRLLGTLEVRPARASLFPAAALGPRPDARGVRRLLFSDGVTPLDAPADFERRSVFQPALNVGIIAFEAARSGSLVQAFVEVLNGSLEPVIADLLLDTAAGETLVRRPLRLAPAERWSGVIDLAPLADVVAASPVLHARVSTEGDALALDDQAFAPVPLGAPLRVAIAGPPGTSVSRVLDLFAGFATRAIDVEGAAALGPDEVDVLIFEERAPRNPPRVPALLIAPPPRPWLPEPAGDFGPSAWALVDREPSPLDGLRVEAMTRYSEDASSYDGVERDLMAGQVGDSETAASPIPLLLHGGSTGEASRWELLPFAVEGSNLPERSGFPAWLQDLLLELAGKHLTGVVDAGVLELGALEAADSERTFDVSSRRYAEIDGPALLEVDGANAARAVAPLGPRATALNHSDWNRAGFEETTASVVTSSSDLPWRHLLLALALIVASIELWTRSRGITE